MRRLLSRAFVPSAIERLADEIRVVTERLLDAAGPRPDLVHDLAEPLPVAVLGELLGVPLSEQEGRRLKVWCNDFLLPFGRDVRTSAPCPPTSWLPSAPQRGVGRGVRMGA